MAPFPDHENIATPQHLADPVPSDSRGIPTIPCERVPVRVFPSSRDSSCSIATSIAKLIRERQKEGRTAVLGLATGSTPMRLYSKLIKMHRQDGLSFRNVITFNLDEYYPIDKSSPLSYHRFMHTHFFDHVDIAAENIHIPPGDIPNHEVNGFCKQYEEKIEQVGGIDIQILGIGRTGHVGFNEPGSGPNCVTRLVKLDPITIWDAKREFIHEDLVPNRAITMGIATILKARQIFLMASGEKKADIVQRAVESPETDHIPATFLQRHPHMEVFLDEKAASALARVRTPWLNNVFEWSPALTKRAVIWLAQMLEKPILKLTEGDYKNHTLGDLIARYGSFQELNVHVFNQLQCTITGWPGGKPNSVNENRPVKGLPVRKRVIIFSPHPDDDAISMGGTFLRLVEQNHQVHVAYQTSGNIAVFDDEVSRYCDFFQMALESLGHKELFLKEYQRIGKSLRSKKPGTADLPVVRKFKGLIRRSEARAAAHFCGLADESIHFLDLPFYETGKTAKKKISSSDIQIMADLIKKIRPHQIFAAGDLHDPHGTHETCLNGILLALESLESELWIRDCTLWLYRGAWHEWPIDEIEMAVPLSPMDIERKRKAIFKHQSQKDTPVFPGDDKREFWQRAEERNVYTAHMFDLLGTRRVRRHGSLRPLRFPGDRAGTSKKFERRG